MKFFPTIKNVYRHKKKTKTHIYVKLISWESKNQRKVKPIE